MSRPLLAFLRGAPPQPNPRPAWVVRRRGATAATGTPWEEVARSTRRRDALAEIEAPPGPHRPFDVLRLEGPGAAAEWFVGEDGQARPLRPPVDTPGLRIDVQQWLRTHPGGWVEAWEEAPQAEHLLLLAQGVGLQRARLAAIARAMARRALLAAEQPDPRLARALDAAEADPEGQDGDAVLLLLDDAVRGAEVPAPRSSRRGRGREHPQAPYERAMAVRAAVRAGRARFEAGTMAAEAARWTTQARSNGAWARARAGHNLAAAQIAQLAEQRAQAELVRTHLPLGAFLLAATGDG